MHPIDQLCKEYDLSRNRLATQSGITESVLSSLTRNNTPIAKMKLGTLLKLADGLSLDIGDLIKKLIEYENNPQSN